MQNTKKNWQGYLFLLLAQLMVGICIVGSKALLMTMPAVFILFIRFSIGFLFLLFTHLAISKEKFQPLKKLSQKDWGIIFAQALCAGALFNILLLWGLDYTTASVAGIITSMLPAIVVVFSILLLKEKVTLYTVLCISFAVIGLMVINAHSLHIDNTQQIYGGFIILLSLLPEAAYYIMAKKHKNKLPIFLVSALMNIINVPIFLLGLFIIHHNSVTLQVLGHEWLLLFIVGMTSALFYVFWFLGCQQVQGSNAGLTTAFMPIATLTIAYLFLHEKVTVLQFLGMVLVILSIFLNVLKPKKNIFTKL